MQSLPSASATGPSRYPAGPQTAGHRVVYCPAQWVTETSTDPSGPSGTTLEPSQRTCTKAPLTTASPPSGTSPGGTASLSQATTSVPSERNPAQGNHSCSPESVLTCVRLDHVSPPSVDSTTNTSVSEPGPAPHGS